ncbi:hypothetical protein HYH02_013655 [Chlamydomonas schloesseri]|uniref:Allene oxide cyclase barrel-like domain-containing protein n=1 Tax=Chlamydomonas schloesseri TaxID=2026947 RepID=A0A835SNZ5_9CHLO|nr:hypothetical protein HYH02_013655 [Chlamydomonas schloesseri]|eukprot:KAG2430657.1 hypothetical protein HYH02_013655 [Chlamydomonas schloesseri]
MKTAVAILLLSALALANAQSICKKSFTVTENYVEKTSALVGCTDAECTYAFSNPLVVGTSASGKTKAGDNIGTCTVFSSTAAGENRSYCMMSLKTPSGIINFGGEFPDFKNGDFTMPVTGGTGAFLGASGAVRCQVVKPGYTWTYTVSLTKAPTCASRRI